MRRRPRDLCSNVVRSCLGVGLAAVLSTFALSACGGGEEAAATRAQPASLRSVQEAAIERYGWYLLNNAGELVDWTTQLRGQVAAGEVAKAQSRYATARVQFGQIEPAAVLFPAVELRIDGQPGEVSGPFVGFHRIERSLFGEEETTAKLKPIAKLLLEDVGRLHNRLRFAELSAGRIATGALAVLRDVLAGEAAGREEVYARVDPLDVAANLEGTEAAFEAVRPTLAYRDPRLTRELEAAFVEAFGAVGVAGIPARQPQTRPAAAGAGFVWYEDLSAEEQKAIAESIEALAGLFARAQIRLSG